MSTLAPSPPAWRVARRLLAVRLDNLGDMLLATPAIHAIRESLPDARLSVLASPVGAQAARLNPDIDEVISYQAPWVDPWMQLPHDPQREAQLIGALREREFDAAVIFSSFRQSSLPAAYVCYLADIPLRLGASIDGSGSLLTTRHRHPLQLMHEVERGLDLVAAVGIGSERRELVLQVPEDARRRIAAWLDQHQHEAGPLVVIHPGCTMPARTYPAERFAQVADSLIEQLGARVVLTGAADEARLAAQIGAQMRQKAIAAAGALSFAEFAALIEAADLLITNNTGPMHMAAALGTPVVTLFALTNPPAQWGPWRVPHRLLYRDVPCRLCYSRVCPTDHACLLGVTPTHVLAAAADLLAETELPVRSREVGHA